MLEEMAEGPVEWLFSPKNIRQLFREHYKTYKFVKEMNDSGGELEIEQQNRESHELN